MSDYRIEVTLKATDRRVAMNAHHDLTVYAGHINAGHINAGASAVGTNANVVVGELAEIETCQVVGIKDGREVDLGDLPLTPELKAREFARQYGDPDNEDDVEANTALYCMHELIKWMKEQGKLK